MFTHKAFGLHMLLYVFSCRSFRLEAQGVGMIEVFGLSKGFAFIYVMFCVSFSKQDLASAFWWQFDGETMLLCYRWNLFNSFTLWF